MKYIDADKLIAEIKRRKDIHRKNYEEFKDERFINDECEDDRVLSLITSLQQEQPSEDLEREIETYFKGWYMDETDQGYILHTPDDHAGLMSAKQVARHFAEWGAEHLKK